MGRYNKGIVCIGKDVYINGEKLPPVPDNGNGRNINVVQTNGRIFVNGYEWKDGKWVKNIRSFMANWF